METLLPSIPITDLRDGGPLRHARESGARARALRDDCLTFFPRAAVPLIPALDWASHQWLRRSSSPYVNEITQIAATLGFAGVWLLNGSYQWGCTALAREEDGVPWLARTLDWPFAGLGRHAEVGRLQGDAGEFFSVTWPGYAGVLTAMAPNRFAACINQAPLWRRTRRPSLRVFDIAANALRTWSEIRHTPPDQLLRQAFERCETFEAARHVLERTPVARPVIYTLIGCAPSQRCVIERTEESFVTREHTTSVANDWVPPRAGWEARLAPAHMMTLSSAEAMEQNIVRRETIANWPGRLSGGGFEWVTPPVLNPYTRLAVVTSPARASMHVIGYERLADERLPVPVTQACEIEAQLAA
jgi:hypothetical protein